VQLADDVGGPIGMTALGAQAQQMADSAKKLLASAQAGGFGFQPEAADTMIKALRDSIDDLDKLDQDLDIVSRAPQLGRTPAAVVVGPFTQLVAIDEQGIVRAVKNFRQMMVDMIAACEEAKNHYTQSDTSTAHHLRRLHH
jgi:hypothetical protein